MLKGGKKGGILPLLSFVVFWGSRDLYLGKGWKNYWKDWIGIA